MLFVLKIDKATSEDLATPSIDEAKKKIKKQSKRNTIKMNTTRNPKKSRTRKEIYTHEIVGHINYDSSNKSRESQFYRFVTGQQVFYQINWYFYI